MDDFNKQSDINSSGNQIQGQANQTSENYQGYVQNNVMIPINIPTDVGEINQSNDERLLKAFIGVNYDKIIKKKFNIAGFFFTSFYMFYRKLFGYGILLVFLELVLLAFIKVELLLFLINILVGLFINSFYVCVANKKISKIKSINPEKSIEQLEAICSAKGGRSIGWLFLGLLVEIIMIYFFVVIIPILGLSNNISKSLKQVDDDVYNNSGENNVIDDANISSDIKLNENVTINGYSCSLQDKCVIMTTEGNDSVNYILSANNQELIKVLGHYTDYVKVNIYYKKSGNDKIIVDYKVFLKSNNEDVSNITDEEELRKKIGLYTTGTYTASFIFYELGSSSVGFDDDYNTYNYTSYKFIDNKDIEYDMRYISEADELDLIEGNTYEITFNVVKGFMGYDFIIKSIK